MTTLSSREFNQETSRAKRAALEGPVFITDRGVPAHVLLSIDEYRRLTAGSMSLKAAVQMPSSEDIEFDPPRLSSLARSVDFE